MAGVVSKLRANLAPKVTMGVTLALLLLRLTLGWGLFEAGKGKVHTLMGSCASDPMPECESESAEECGKDVSCKAKIPAKCAADRSAACAEKGQRTIEWFGSLTIAGNDALKLPGGGKLNFAAAGFTELIFGLFVMLGLLTRLSALPLIATMTVAMLTAHWDTVGLNLAFVGELAFVYWIGLWVLVASGPGDFSLDRAIQK